MSATSMFAIGDELSSRCLMAAGLATAIVLATGPVVIRFLRRRFGDPIRSPSDTLRELHAGKRNTPTMGGLFLLPAILAAAAVTCDGASPGFLAGAFCLLGLGLIGAIDDALKLFSRSNGLSPRAKLFGQFAVVTPIIVWLDRMGNGSTCIVPWSDMPIELGMWFVPLATLVVVASSNAVNLTDGLDGLAPGCIGVAAAALSIVTASAAGDANIAVVLSAVAGASFAFLWFNAPPAQVFLGDVGALPLGGVLGLAAVISGQWLAWLVIGGVFALEAVSVMMQIVSFRMFGKRVFRCAPAHHHFQFAGWPESRIVIRFWIAAGLFAAIGVRLSVGAWQISPSRTDDLAERQAIDVDRRTVGQEREIGGEAGEVARTDVLRTAAVRSQSDAEGSP